MLNITYQDSQFQWSQALCYFLTSPIRGGWRLHPAHRRLLPWFETTALRPPLHRSSTLPQAARSWLHVTWCCHPHIPPRIHEISEKGALFGAHLWSQERFDFPKLWDKNKITAILMSKTELSPRTTVAQMEKSGWSWLLPGGFQPPDTCKTSV